MLKKLPNLTYASFQRIFVGKRLMTSSSKIETTSTVDQNEIAHFTDCTVDWWNEMGIMKPLHSMNNIRIPFVRDSLINAGIVNKDAINTSKPLQGLELLDVGCGGGILTEGLARLGANVTGLDACKDLIECAESHVKRDSSIVNSVKYVLESIEDHNSGENCNKYDGVIASEIVEHVNSPRLFLESCCGVLKPGGSIFVTTMNKTFIGWLGGIVIAENVIRVVPKGTHDWNKFISPHELQRVLEEFNCQTKCVHGLFYNFLWNQWYWFPDNSINYALHAVKTS